jgi:hypothetical protein
MTKVDYKAVLKRCTELTANGATLCVTWDGGGDDGEFDLEIDGVTVWPLEPVDEMIICMVQLAMDFYSFDGPNFFYGELQYDPVKACFFGKDTMESGDHDTLDCSIKIAVPKEIWFDRLDLGVAIGDDEASSAVRLTVLNGPRIQAHFDLEAGIKDSIWCALCEEFEWVENWTRAYLDTNIPIEEFAPEGNWLVYTLNKVQYDFNAYQDTEINISITDKIEEDDNNL